MDHKQPLKDISLLQNRESPEYVNPVISLVLVDS